MTILPSTGDNQFLPLRFGVSRCLLGEAVRYDGGHKKLEGLLQPLAAQATLFGVCPEVEIGLGVPRDPIQLVQTGARHEVLGVHDASRRFGAALQRCADDTLRRQQADGWILKSASPSCGVQDTPVFDPGGQQLALASGAFAARLAQKQPACPMITERQLADPELRDNFLERVFVYRRWRQWSAHGMDEEKCRAFQLGIRLQWGMRAEPRAEPSVCDETYLLALMQGLGRPLGRQDEVRALRQWLNDPQSGLRQTQALVRVLDAYQQGQCDRAGVVVSFNDALAGAPPLAFYFSPEMAEWCLRYRQPA